MAVIAKMNINDVKPYPQDSVKLFLNCVCENGLMAHYSPENEDAVFTKYSPGGSCEIQLDAGVEHPERNGQVYVLFHLVDEVPSFEGCMFAKLARVSHVTDWGQSKQVVMGAAAKLWDQEQNCYHELPDNIIPAGKIASDGCGFEYKITIDNPHASVQFVPQGLYWISFYDAAKLTMAEALRLARA